MTQEELIQLKEKEAAAKKFNKDFKSPNDFEAATNNLKKKKARAKKLFSRDREKLKAESLEEMEKVRLSKLLPWQIKLEEFEARMKKKK